MVSKATNGQTWVAKMLSVRAFLGIGKLSTPEEASVQVEKHEPTFNKGVYNTKSTLAKRALRFRFSARDSQTAHDRWWSLTGRKGQSVSQDGEINVINDGKEKLTSKKIRSFSTYSLPRLFAMEELCPTSPSTSNAIVNVKIKHKQFHINPIVYYSQAYSSAEYDRKGTPLTPLDDVGAIRDELDHFKLFEMEVHVESRCYTHIYGRHHFPERRLSRMRPKGNNIFLGPNQSTSSLYKNKIKRRPALPRQSYSVKRKEDQFMAPQAEAESQTHPLRPVDGVTMQVVQMQQQLQKLQLLVDQQVLPTDQHWQDSAQNAPILPKVIRIKNQNSSLTDSFQSVRAFGTFSDTLPSTNIYYNHDNDNLMMTHQGMISQGHMDGMINNNNIDDSQVGNMSSQSVSAYQNSEPKTERYMRGVINVLHGGSQANALAVTDYIVN